MLYTGVFTCWPHSTYTESHPNGPKVSPQLKGNQKFWDRIRLLMSKQGHQGGNQSQNPLNNRQKGSQNSLFQDSQYVQLLGCNNVPSRSISDVTPPPVLQHRDHWLCDVIILAKRLSITNSFRAPSTRQTTERHNWQGWVGRGGHHDLHWTAGSTTARSSHWDLSDRHGKRAVN